MKNKSFSGVVIMSETSTIKVLLNHLKMFLFLTFIDIFSQKIQEFLDLKLNGQRDKEMLMKTTKCYSKTYKLWAEIHFSSQTVLFRNCRNCSTLMECSKTIKSQCDEFIFLKRAISNYLVYNNLNL